MLTSAGSLGRRQGRRNQTSPGGLPGTPGWQPPRWGLRYQDDARAHPRRRGPRRLREHDLAWVLNRPRGPGRAGRRGRAWS